MEPRAGAVIRVMVVEDSPLMCKLLTSILNADPQTMVVGVAMNGKEAVELVPRLKPDIITMDMDMPVMDGLETTKQIMASHPTRILIVSSSAFKVGTEKIFRAISHGALDVMDKSEIEFVGDRRSGDALVAKIKYLTSVRMADQALGKSRPERSVVEVRTPVKKASDRIVALVASTGGPQALLKVLQKLPGDFPSGIVVVQHITSGFLSGLVDWLGKECKIKVKIGEAMEPIRPGVVYIAPDNFHMKVESGGKIILSDDPPVGGHRPSGDILLESVARTYGRGSVGAILTGMGRDGVMGMKAIREFRGKTIAQDEKSCAVFGMPNAAIEMNIIDKILPIEGIAEEIASMVR
jgi:two-component system chemotaxis response regulator CheB